MEDRLQADQTLEILDLAFELLVALLRGPQILHLPLELGVPGREGRGAREAAEEVADRLDTPETARCIGASALLMASPTESSGPSSPPR